RAEDRGGPLDRGGDRPATADADRNQGGGRHHRRPDPGEPRLRRQPGRYGMNDNTVTLIHRPFGDLVDDSLTAVRGGVVHEPIQFAIKVFRYPLAEPAASVR